VTARVTIVGASGYAGGELLRLIHGHADLQVGQVISRSRAGQPVHAAHPNLRGQALPNFDAPEALAAADVLILALPHGEAQQDIERYNGLADNLIDLSADFRLQSDEAYQQWYGQPHATPAWLSRFTYGLPELNREAIRAARYVSGVGCNAAASILALFPLVRSNLLRPERPIVVEVKVGSSEGGAKPNPGSHHPARSGVVRSYAPVGHRHTAEVQQAFGSEGPEVHLSLTAVEMVRGALATAQAWVQPGTGEKDLWRIFREVYADEPFVRIVRERRGVHRRPEPKLLAGSNFADVSFDLDSATGRVVALCAIDNLMKGAAGNAMQCLNLMLGLEERAGLGFPGLHPI